MRPQEQDHDFQTDTVLAYIFADQLIPLAALGLTLQKARRAHLARVNASIKLV